MFGGLQVADDELGSARQRYGGQQTGGDDLQRGAQCDVERRSPGDGRVAASLSLCMLHDYI